MPESLAKIAKKHGVEVLPRTPEDVNAEAEIAANDAQLPPEAAFLENQLTPEEKRAQRPLDFGR